MKFKCIKLEKPTSSRFTVGKVYPTVHERFVVNDLGHKSWISTSLEHMIGQGDVSINGQIHYDWPLFAIFEEVSD